MGFSFSFFHSPKPKGYYHRPIYWDPEKERHDEVIAETKKNNGIVEENTAGEKVYHSSITRGSFRRNRMESKEYGTNMEHARKERKAANMRFLIIVLLLLAITLLIVL